MFDILYPKFVTDFKKRPPAAVYREMEEDLEAQECHKSPSPAVLNSPLDSSRSDRDCGLPMPPLSPIPARGASYTDQCSEATSDISKTILDVSGADNLAKMKYVAKFLQSMSGHDREYASDTEAQRHLERYAMSNWRNTGAGKEKINAGFPPTEREFSSPRDRDFASDGYSSEGTKEESLHQRLPNDYYVNRSPGMDGGKTGLHYEMTDDRSGGGVDGGRGDEKHRQFQNYLKSQTGGYDLNVLDSESRYHSPSGKKFSMMPASVEENPLAAMLQKFAVSDDHESSSVFPLKSMASVAASMYSGRGLPKKRHFRSDLAFPSSISYGLPPFHNSSAMSFGGAEKSSSHPDVFICHICSFVATSNEDFKAHMTIHYDYQCPQCTYSSRTEGRLKRHIKDFHGASDSAVGDEESLNDQQSQKTNQPKKFKCRQCHCISYSREEHWRHITVHIKKEKQLKCIHCPFVTEFKHHLEYHIRNHNNSKPYKCGKCNYTCVNKSMLNSHMKSHTNVYQFRCASCKYATKYSHSLKLHLINKKHVPAVVLNPDGSLPTDGSGNFDLISKRGPPRGPRGPRKSKPMTDEVSPRGLLPIFPTSSSPIMSFGHGSEYPWIPAQKGKPLNGIGIPGTLPTINGALLSTAGTLSSQSLGYPLNILSQLSSSVTPPVVSHPLDRMPPDRMPPATAGSVPCGFCPASFSSLALLADHVKMEHALKLGGFGVKLEAKSPTQESAAISFPDRSLCEKKIYAEEASCHVQGFNPKPESEMFAYRNVDVHSNKGEVEKKESAANEATENPLDLSSKNSIDVKRMAVKRSAIDSITAMSRKRSRKGKACKLDELSLRLQDHWKEEDGLLEGSESSSLDGECPPALGKPSAGKETERKFSEVGCGTSSPPVTTLNDSGSWSWRKESSPQYSDADSSDQRRENKTRAEARGESLKPNEFSDQEPGSDNSNTNSSEGFAISRAKSNAPTQQPPDNGYYTCNYCDMGFRDNVTHFLHMGYHTFDDPFKCNKCGHRSTDAVDFFVHMARVAHTQ